MCEGNPKQSDKTGTLISANPMTEPAFGIRLHEKHVGILALEVYTPSTFIKQSKLEKHCGVESGKYTKGLGQEGLAICGDAEDVNSLSLTVVHSLLEKYKIDPTAVGRVEVGTETLVDKSKSTKTVLMDLFPGNTDIEGATVVNACYGGTAALLNAFSWVESDGWDGRYAIVVAADIATYAPGPARPTSGAGAVALLVGRDAPLSFNPRERATHSANTWDFFKPDPTVEYPEVDGALSQSCYYAALENVYNRLAEKINKVSKEGVKEFDAESPDYWVFHAPYNKLVQKSYGRLFLMDARRNFYDSEGEEEKKDATDLHGSLTDWLTKPSKETYGDKVLESQLKHLSARAFEERLSDANMASKLVGNTYTASVFLGLASLIDRAGGRGQLTPGKTLGIFSYGSGSLATMYRLHVRTPTSQTKFDIKNMARKLNLMDRLASREEVHPAELDYALDTRARMHRSGEPYSPVYPTNGRLFPGTYYLNGIDAKFRRTYSRVPLDAGMDTPGEPLAPPVVVALHGNDAVSHTATGKLQNRRIDCVITGTSAGLPGGQKVFQDGNLDRLIEGQQCITPLSVAAKEEMLERNVVQTMKTKEGKVIKVPVDSEERVIKLAAQLGPLDLSDAYGVPKTLAKTMDIAAQVAVAAGLEALKSAGLVRGLSNNPEEWLLPEQYRDTTGVVYASSFPAMDAAVGEVMRFLKSKTVDASHSNSLVTALRNRMVSVSKDGQLSDQDEEAFALLSRHSSEMDAARNSSSDYEFDRKFLFRVLVLGNAQLAQLAGCRGPNTQTNAACAGTTQAIAMAQDMLITGRAERVVVIAGDNASGETLMSWLGSGFRALGAATTQGAVEDAALPFDKRRTGMLLGAGGIGMVVETQTSSLQRQKLAPYPFRVRARLLATLYSNSAYHGAALDREHIGAELDRFLSEVEVTHGINRAEIATHGVYLSHETCTHASSASSCAGNEIAALRTAFGDESLKKLLILNTKGFTGHPMGVSFEDVAAVEVLLRQRVPPVPNYSEQDGYLGELNISKGGKYACRYALRFAAGFGSQVAFALYSTS